jgi:hypothetical protein
MKTKTNSPIDIGGDLWWFATLNARWWLAGNTPDRVVRV